MPVSDQNALYIANKDRWQLVRDCVEGSDAIKSRRKSSVDNQGKTSNISGFIDSAGSRYLPIPNPLDASDENRQRYEAYRQRANFVNFTGHTKDGFAGMVSRKESIIDLDKSVDFMEDNVDGAGLGLQELIHRTISELLQVGRFGLLADFPESEEGKTAAQTLGLQSTIKRYPAESIINWRTEVIGGVNTLVMVVLREAIEVVNKDGFGVENAFEHRVLLLREGVYVQNIYDKDDELKFFKDGDNEDSADIIPRKSDGSTWDLIPFRFIGAIDNDASPDKAPLYDLAEINISHYRNSADFEESSFLVGQPTPVITGLTQQWVDDVLKTGIQLGSRTGLMLPADSDAKLLQAEPNQMPSKGMEIKEEQMIKIGAKIITDSRGVETAEAAKIRFSGQNSKLGQIVLNTQKGILQCLAWANEFMGGSGESKIEVNRDFYDSSISPQLLVSQFQALDRGIVAKKDVRGLMRQSGLIDPDRTDEEIDGEAESISPIE